MATNRVRIFEVEIEGLKEVEPGYLLGTMTVLGVQHHVEFIRVQHNNNGDLQEVYPGDHLNQQRYDDMQSSYDGYYYTIELDEFGFEGTYVMRVFPFTH